MVSPLNHCISISFTWLQWFPGNSLQNLDVRSWKKYLNSSVFFVLFFLQQRVFSERWEYWYLNSIVKWFWSLPDYDYTADILTCKSRKSTGLLKVAARCNMQIFRKWKWNLGTAKIMLLFVWHVGFNPAFIDMIVFGIVGSCFCL